MIRDEIAARQLAAAVNSRDVAREAVLMHPKVGDEFRAQLRERDEAEQAFREAFRKVTGMTLVYSRSAYGVRY